jgi:putative effector of murein hydrolase LrgA (UPF0299 family)
MHILGLWAFNVAGVWIVQRTALPIPGNLVGTITLYGCWLPCVIKLCGSRLTDRFSLHLAFFFVPIHARSKRRHRHFSRWMDFAASAP